MSPQPENPRVDPLADTVPAKKPKIHICKHIERECKVHEIEGTAPMVFNKQQQKMIVNGPSVTISHDVYKLPPGSVVKEVNSQFGPVPKGSGVVSWSLNEDGDLVIRPSMEVDLKLEIHLED